MKTAQQEWQEVAAEIGLHKISIPLVQMQEMRSAFMAGQLAMIQFILNHVSANAEDKALAQSNFEKRAQEVFGYFKAVPTPPKVEPVELIVKP